MSQHYKRTTGRCDNCASGDYADLIEVPEMVGSFGAIEEGAEATLCGRCFMNYAIDLLDPTIEKCSDCLDTIAPGDTVYCDDCYSNEDYRHEDCPSGTIDEHICDYGDCDNEAESAYCSEHARKDDEENEFVSTVYASTATSDYEITYQDDNESVAYVQIDRT